MILLIKNNKINNIIKNRLLEYSKKEIKENKFIKTLLFLLTKKNKSYKLFISKFSYKLLLFKYIEFYNKKKLEDNIKNKIKNKEPIKYEHIFFLIDLFKTININFIDIYYYDRYIYKLILSNKIDKKTFDEPPEILLLFHNNLCSNFINFIKNKEKNEVIDSSIIKGVNEFKQIIEFNGINYKLEACLLDNLIIGLTIDNNNIIYNSCNYIQFEWKDQLYSFQKSFNIKNKDCKLHKLLKDENYDINFGSDIDTNERNGDLILIYVRIKEEESKEEESKEEESKEEESINIKSLEYSSKSIKGYIKYYYELKNKSLDELKEILLDIGYLLIDISNITRENIIEKLEDKYKELFKIKSTDIKKDEETIIKNFMKRLIKKYLKDKTIYSFIELFKLDDKIIKEIDMVSLSKFNRENLIKIYLYLYSIQEFEEIQEKEDINIDNIYLINKIKEKLYKDNFCSNLEVIPQISHTCWFNAILMILLYSQETRKITYDLSLEWSKEEIKEDKMKSFFKYMLKYNYKNPEKIRKLFEGKMKPELLLMSLLIKEKQKINIDKFKEKLKKNIYDFSYFIYAIDIILSSYNYKYLSLYYIDNTIHKNIYNDKLRIDETSEIPEIILLYHEKLYDKTIDKNEIEELTYEDFDTKYYGKTTGIEEYKKIISINDIEYELDSCLINNYNYNDNKHIIAGITCGNESFVYNGWNKTEEKEIYEYTYLKNINKACNLFKYDWKRNLYKENEGFCLSKSICNLEGIDEEDLCFNFSKGYKALIYTRIKEDIKIKKLKTLDITEDSRLELESKISFKSKSISPLIREFYNLEEKTIEELKEILVKIGYIINDIQEIDNKILINKYRLLYIYLLNKDIREENNNEETLKEFLIKLIKEYMKYDKLYDLYLYIDININKKNLIDFLKNIEEDKFINIYKIVTEGKEIIREIPSNFNIKLINELSKEDQLMIYNIINNIILEKGGNKKKIMRKYNK